MGHIEKKGAQCHFLTGYLADLLHSNMEVAMLNMLMRFFKKSDEKSNLTCKDNNPNSLEDLEQIIPEGTLVGDALRGLNHINRKVSHIKPGIRGGGITRARVTQILEEEKWSSGYITQLRIALEREGVDLEEWDSLGSYTDKKRAELLWSTVGLMGSVLIEKGLVQRETLPDEALQLIGSAVFAEVC